MNCGRSSRAARSGNRLALLAAALSALLIAALPSAPARAAGPPPGHGHRPTNPGQPGRGELLPLLPDGSPATPSTYFTEATEHADVLDPGDWEWDVSILSASADWLDSKPSQSLEWMHADVRRGMGHGLELAARAETWDHASVSQDSVNSMLEESGFGATTLYLRRGLIEDQGAATSCVGLLLRIPGSAGSPSTHAVEGGAFVPLWLRLNERSRLGMMLKAEWVGGVFDTSHHLEEIASVEWDRQLSERLAVRGEAVSVWFGEQDRPWLGVLDAGLSIEPLPHFGLMLGATSGTSGGVSDAGAFGRVSIHS